MCRLDHSVEEIEYLNRYDIYLRYNVKETELL